MLCSTEIDEVHGSVKKSVEDDTDSTHFVQVDVIVKWEEVCRALLPEHRQCMAAHEHHHESAIKIQSLAYFEQQRMNRIVG